jgi:heme exporter protein B
MVRIVIGGDSVLERAATSVEIRDETESTLGAYWAVVRRDLLLARRRRVEALLPLGFFVVAAGLFPIGVGPEPQTLRLIAPGVLWVCALLAGMLSVTQVFAGDHADGTLEQMLLSRHGLVSIVFGKITAQWLSGGVPLVLATPLLGVQFGMSAPAIATLCLTLLLGTPVLSALGALGAALTLGLRGGAALVFLLVLPLAVPALIFGTGAVGAVEAGMGAQAHLSLLGAFLIFALLGAPPAIAAALRISLE